MRFDPKKMDDGSLQFTVTLDASELEALKADKAAGLAGFWGKTDYCVTCNNNRKYQIETYGDIAANIEAAATCMKETGNPSYGLSKGQCN